MRLMLMYDLVMETPENIQEYNQFRKKILKLGFYQMQFSIYIKSLPNEHQYLPLLNKLESVIPSQGNIRVIKITEKQYQGMIFLKGRSNLHEIVVGNYNYINFGEIDE